MDNNLLKTALTKYNDSWDRLDDYIRNHDLLKDILYSGYMPVSVASQYDDMYSGDPMGTNIRSETDAKLKRYAFLDYDTFAKYEGWEEGNNLHRGHFTNFRSTVFYYLNMPHFSENDCWQDAVFVFKAQDPELKTQLSETVNSLSKLVKRYNAARKAYANLKSETLDGNRHRISAHLQDIKSELHGLGSGETIYESNGTHSFEILRMNYKREITKLAFVMPYNALEQISLSYSTECENVQKYFNKNTAFLKLLELCQKDIVLVDEAKKDLLVVKLKNF